MDRVTTGFGGAIKTFIIDWPVLVLIGIVFGALAPRPAWWRSRAFAAGFAAACAFTLVAVISYFVAPDWMWMYFLEPSDVTWSVPLIFLGYLAVFVLGFAAAVALKEAAGSALWIAAAVAVAMEVAVIALTWDRYRLIGTASEWLEGNAHELLTASPTGPARTIGLLSPIFFVVAIVAFVVARKSHRATVVDR